jgi:hypothetical protein
VTPKGTCWLAGCERPARARGSLCAAHDRARLRGAPLGAIRERLDHRSAVLAAAIAYAEAPAEDDLTYALASERLLAAARRFARTEEEAARAPGFVASSG